MLDQVGVEGILFRVAGMAVFGVFAGNSVDKKGMFSLLLNSANSGSRPSLLFTLALQGGWEGHGKLRRDTAGLAELNWPKEYCILYSIMLSI